MLLVVKMRGSEHTIDMTEYRRTGKGMVLSMPLRGYQGLTSGIPWPWNSVSGENIQELRQDGATTVPAESKEEPHE
jgi:hypothetical protein